MADDKADLIKPWTIKGIPPEARNAAIAAATREKQTLGEWLARAIRAQVQADRQRERAPAVVLPATPAEADQRADRRADRAGINLGEVERVVDMTARLAEASGAPPPKRLIATAHGLLRDALAEIKRASQTVPRLGLTQGPAGPTESDSGPTGEADGPTETPGGPTGEAESRTERAA